MKGDDQHMKTELYQRIALKISNMGNFIDIHNCGCPTKNWPVNLCCKLYDGTIFYVAKINNLWTIDWSYGETEMRTDMYSVSGIKTQKEMFTVVKKIIRRKLK